MTERQQDQKWLEDSRAEYARRAVEGNWLGKVSRIMSRETGYRVTVSRGAVPHPVGQAVRFK